MIATRHPPDVPPAGTPVRRSRRGSNTLSAMGSRKAPERVAPVAGRASQPSIAVADAPARTTNAHVSQVAAVPLDQDQRRDRERAAGPRVIALAGRRQRGRCRNRFFHRLASANVMAPPATRARAWHPRSGTDRAGDLGGDGPRRGGPRRRGYATTPSISGASRCVRPTIALRVDGCRRAPRRSCPTKRVARAAWVIGSWTSPHSRSRSAASFRRDPRRRAWPAGALPSSGENGKKARPVERRAASRNASNAPWVVFGLTREADDERRAECGVGLLRPDRRDGVEESARRSPQRFMRRNRPGAACCSDRSKVRDDRRQLQHRGDEAGPSPRSGTGRADGPAGGQRRRGDPAGAGAARSAPGSPGVTAVPGEVLGDEDDLPPRRPRTRDATLGLDRLPAARAIVARRGRTGSHRTRTPAVRKPSATFT